MDGQTITISATYTTKLELDGEFLKLNVYSNVTNAVVGTPVQLKPSGDSIAVSYPGLGAPFSVAT